MLKNTNQRRDKNNGAEHAKENERQPFFTHPAKDKIRPFGSEFKQRLKETGNVFNNKQAAFCVEEKERQRDFDHDQL
ncbi:Uncharacterised protein [Enterobacter cloacae]|nr:Uncharacterised protein [Enterobacter cloacae]